MEQKLELGNCYYRPSFFNMKIDLPIDLQDLNSIPEGAMGLYFHEYMHYIQDISTIYGLMNISTITYFIQSCAHHLSKNKKLKNFRVPLKLEEVVENGVDKNYGLLNFSLRPIYLGSPINPKSKTVNNFKFDIVDYRLNTGHVIQKVKICFYDEKGTSRQLEFGGNHVTEGMAYLSEQLNFAGILPVADEYPYAIIERIVEAIYPEILDDKILLIALCDISLMTYHPGLSFVKLVEFIKMENITHKEIEIDEIYSRGLYFLKGSHVDFSELVDIVKVEIMKNFNASYYEDITTWINCIFDTVKILRRDIPSFVVDLVRFGKPRENHFFKLTHKVLGSPLVLNELGYGTISLPLNFFPQGNNFNPGIFLAISQVLKIFYKDESVACELIKYCETSQEQDPNIIIDDNCFRSPWLKSTEEHLCPVGQILHHWALKDYSPKYAYL
jgi:hypothetical protein